ncbi:Calcium-binding component of the spindle pole body (SPB) half-bridge [Ptychographa xylographoides]|nr:Calcium-binding component of the spindle pole body (SPB) half-bridge [Ptychographa xylographoides]
MASSSTHPSFPQRPYNANLGKLPDRTAFNTTSTAQQREAQRLERERERLEKERLEREGQDPMNQLSEEQREEINEAFGLFDLDKDKKIDYHEFKVALKALGFDLPKSELVALLQTHGIPAAPSPHDPSPASTHPTRLLLPLAAFQHLTATRILARDPREEILRAFDLFDEGGKGKIDLQDLRRVARELGEGLGEEELAAMIDEFDLDGDGAIDREEFVGICLQ